MFDFLIIGGGISGLLAAKELADTGAQIGLLDRGPIGREASWAGGGILSPLYPWRQPPSIYRLCQWSQRYYPRLSENLYKITGIDPQWRKCGMLWLNLDDREDALQWCRNQRIQAEDLSAREINSLQPGLVIPGGSPNLWLPEIAQIRNPRLVKALKQYLMNEKRVRLLENCPVRNWKLENGRMAALETPQGSISAETIIFSAGAWSAQWRQSAIWQPEIRPVKGQMLLFRAPQGMLKIMVQSTDHYLIPRQDGRILVGSTVEESGFDKRPTRKAYERLIRFALETLPDLKNHPVELHWAGLRPASPNGIPYIGPHPQLSNVYYNCGHFRNGVVLGPASARLLADLILGRNPMVDPDPYLPRNRFNKP